MKMANEEFLLLLVWKMVKSLPALQQKHKGFEI